MGAHGPRHGTRAARGRISRDIGRYWVRYWEVLVGYRGLGWFWEEQMLSSTMHNSNLELFGTWRSIPPTPAETVHGALLGPHLTRAPQAGMT